MSTHNNTTRTLVLQIVELDNDTPCVQLRITNGVVEHTHVLLPVNIYDNACDYLRQFINGGRLGG